MNDPSAPWTADRPHALVVACSDGRLQRATDDFLRRDLGLEEFDRFYVPGGGGALAASGRDFIRARELRRECQYLITLHHIEHVILLFHGPAADGPSASVCADYRRKLPWATPDQILLRQLQDLSDLREQRSEWAATATVDAYRAEVNAASEISVRPFKTRRDAVDRIFNHTSR